MDKENTKVVYKGLGVSKHFNYNFYNSQNLRCYYLVLVVGNYKCGFEYINLVGYFCCCNSCGFP